MENLGVTTQESDISTITDENEVRKAGNGSGVKKRSYTLDLKIALLEELDAAILVNPKGTLSRIAKLQTITTPQAACSETKRCTL